MNVRFDREVIDMADLKTKPTGKSVDAFLGASCGDERMTDCRRLVEIMRRVTGAEPVMWGDSIVGFGGYHYRYASGREGDWFPVGFSPRKREFTVYVMAGLEPYGELLTRLGKHRTGKGCLYIKRLSDVDENVLTELLEAAVTSMRAPDGHQS